MRELRRALDREGERGNAAGRPGAGTAADERPREDDALVCVACGHRVWAASDRIEVDGAHAHRFLNPVHVVYHVGCFARADGCREQGEESDHWTWFPGHTWQVSLCARCATHLGWRFRSTGGGSFHGLILDRIASGPGGS